MIITLDIGNSRIKGAVFQNNTLIDQWADTPSGLPKKICNVLQIFPNTEAIVVVSVTNIPIETLLPDLKNIKIIVLNREDVFPFQNLYHTPNTLGLDRMVLAAGAVLMYPNQNRLIIDAGTCITYDFVDAQNNYLGGSISPGLQMRFQALHTFTSKLPLIEASSQNLLIGNSSQTAIQSGVEQGIIFEIDGFIKAYREVFKKFTIILTGGDTVFLAKRLKSTIFANPNFLLESLNAFFQYKNQQ